jgi:hypothetical protein
METKVSAAELLAKRGRAKVASRNDDLNNLIGTKQNSEERPTVDSSPGAKIETGDLISDWKQELQSLPEISNFMLRVEQSTKEEIQSYAKKQGVTAETLIQAMWISVKEDSERLQSVLVQAQKHHKRRARAAELKNLITRAEKIS